MKLPNTKHLINSSCVTVFCLKENEHLLLNKLLSELDNDGYIVLPSPNPQTMDEFAEEYLKSSQNRLTVVDLNDDIASDKADIKPQKNKLAMCVLRVSELINFADKNNAHIITTLLINNASDWRSVHFRIAEQLKDKVCFVRLVSNDDNSDIRLKIESGENAWQYIPYNLDGNGSLAEK